MEFHLQAPLCNSSNAAQLSSACLSPPASEAPTTVDGNDTTVRQNGASMGHLSVLDSTVFTDLHSKQLPARTKFYEFYNAPISKFWAHSVRYYTLTNCLLFIKISIIITETFYLFAWSIWRTVLLCVKST